MKRLQNVALRWPVIDLLLPVLLVLTWSYFNAPDLDRTATDLILTALAAAGGLVMAVATFSAGMMYQSTESTVVEMRQEYSHQLRDNWTWIICTLLAATLIPIVGMALTKDHPLFGIYAALISLSLIVSNLARVVYLLRLVLFLASYNGERHKPAPEPQEKF